MYFLLLCTDCVYKTRYFEKILNYSTLNGLQLLDNDSLVKLVGNKNLKSTCDLYKYNIYIYI